MGTGRNSRGQAKSGDPAGVRVPRGRSLTLRELILLLDLELHLFGLPEADPFRDVALLTLLPPLTVRKLAGIVCAEQKTFVLFL